jgi:hypothetical protein
MLPPATRRDAVSGRAAVQTETNKANVQNLVPCRYVRAGPAHQRGAKPWPETKREIGDKLLTFFGMFGEKVRGLSQSTTCNCNACAHIGKLRLKVVVHSGEALFHQVLNFHERARRPRGSGA